MLLKNRYLYTLILIVSCIVVITTQLGTKPQQTTEYVTRVLYVIEGPDCYESTRENWCYRFVNELKPCCSNHWNRHIILTDLDQSKLYQYVGDKISVTGVLSETTISGVSFNVINQAVITN